MPICKICYIKPGESEKTVATVKQMNIFNALGVQSVLQANALQPKYENKIKKYYVQTVIFSKS